MTMQKLNGTVNISSINRSKLCDHSKNLILASFDIPIISWDEANRSCSRIGGTRLMEESEYNDSQWYLLDVSSKMINQKSDISKSYNPI